MNKKEFLSSIEARISNLPQNDRMKSLEYYGEMIDDRIEEGMSEETAVEAMGSIDDIVSQILLDASLPALVKFKVRPSRTLRVWEILLIILGSPIWLPLLLSFAIIILSVYIVIWSILISLYAVDLSIAVGFLAGIFMGIIFAVTGFGIQAAWLIGSGFICGGISILLLIAFNGLTKMILKLSRQLIRKIKLLFIGKKNNSKKAIEYEI